ncbi:MAG: glycosyltransferase family 4 protein [Planctomycetes bacterium]|nr:glycosyltransferase family 4 protein [Planctomycetota bacterium]
MTTPLRVVFVTTHPIQYQVPWMRGVAQTPGIDAHVLYGMLPDAKQQGVGFGVAFTWDVPLLEGYAWSALENVASAPSLSTREGIDTPDIGRRLAELAPDVVVVCGWQSRSLVQAARSASKLRLPVVVRGESNDLRPRPLWKRLLHRAFLKRFDAALAIGTANARFLRAAGMPASAITLAPYSVDTRHLADAARDRARFGAAARARWDIPEDAVVALFVGKLEAKKRPLNLVEAVARALPNAGNLHLLVIGAGPLDGEVKARAKAFGVPATFTGFLNQGELGPAYAAGDVFVLPSDHGETWGLVVNEAQYVGLPVVVSDQVGCGPDLVTPGRTGWVYACGDVDALAARLVQLAQDREMRGRLGAAGKARVADFTIERAVEATVGALRAVVAKRRAP